MEKINPINDIKYSMPPILEFGSTAIIPPNKVIFIPRSINLKPEAPFLKPVAIRVITKLNTINNTNVTGIIAIFTPPSIIFNFL